MPLFADNIRSAYAALVVAAVIIAGLVFGKDVLIPLAIASCLAFVLSPIVRWVATFYIPRSVAVVAVAVITTLTLGAVSTLIISQTVSLAAELGTYRANLVEKIRTVTQTAKSDGVIRRATEAVLSLETEISKEMKSAGSTPAAPATGSDARTPPPLVVTVDTSTKSVWDHLGVLAQPLATAGLTFLFTLFILFQTQDLRDRLVRVVGTDNVGGTTSAINDAAERLSGLFLTQAVMNVSFGTVVGVLLWIIGVPNAVLWGGLTILMRFVPYVGSFLAAIPPILLAAAVDPGWGMAFATLILFVVGESIMGHAVEPVVLGPKAGLSPFAMLLSASFWTLIWGPIGLILAAPLTLTLVVLGRYVKGLEFITVLLGDEPALSPREKLYHRLLSGDVLGAAQQLDASGDTPDLIHQSDAVMLPALRIAAADFERGQLDRDRISELHTTATEMMLAFEASPSGDDAKRANGDRGSLPSVLLLPARTEVDKAAAEFVALALEAERDVRATSAQKGTGLTAISSASQTGDEMKVHPDMVVIVTTGSGDTQYLPLICRRAVKSFPGAAISILDAGLDAGSSSPSVEGLKSLPSVVRFSTVARLAEQIGVTRSSSGAHHAKAS